MSGIQTFDFSVDLLRALLWQFNDAARLQSLLTQKQAWYDTAQSEFWEDWVRDVFDLRTANDFGLTVWAIILGVPLSMPGEEDQNKPVWGFGEYRVNFTNGNFAPVYQRPLTTEQRRIVLRLRYFQLTTRGTVPEINAFFADLFSDLGPVYVNDALEMNARYVFGFPLSPDLEAVIAGFDLLPRPAGVTVDYVILPSIGGWGFGQYRHNFNNGNFYHA